MIFLDLINLRKIRKALLYLFCIVAGLWLQTMVFSRLAPLDVKPFFLPALVVAIGLLEGCTWGAAAGIAAGLLCDAALVSSDVLCLILFALFGFFSGFLADYFINRRFVSCLLLEFLALAITAGFQAAPLWLFHGAAPLPLLVTAVLQTLWSLPFGVPAYFLVKRISGRARTRRR